MAFVLFKDDVGKIFTCKKGTNWKVVSCDTEYDNPFILRELNHCSARYSKVTTVNKWGKNHWHGIELTGPAKTKLHAMPSWWNVYINSDGQPYGLLFSSYDTAVKLERHNQDEIVSRVYRVHWSGVEVGIFETPEEVMD